MEAPSIALKMERTDSVSVLSDIFSMDEVLSKASEIDFGKKYTRI